MCRGAGFHADKARSQGLEELYQLAAAELLSDDDLLGRVDAVNLEYVLGTAPQILSVFRERRTLTTRSDL
jgi:hypothetical protein